MRSGAITFGLCPKLHDDAHRDDIDVICELMADDIGRPVEPVIAPSPSALADALASGEAQFGWVSPTLLLMSSRLATMVPLLSSVREGAAVFRSVVFACSDGPRTLDEARGARAAWVDPTSASGYLVPRLTMARLGFPLDMLGDEIFVESHGEVGRAVYEGRADIGGTYARFRGGDPDGELLDAGFLDPSFDGEACILATSGPITADLIAAHPLTPLTTRIAFAAALCRLVHDPTGSTPIRRIIGAEDFHPVSFAALDELRELAEAARQL